MNIKQKFTHRPEVDNLGFISCDEPKVRQSFVIFKIYVEIIKNNFGNSENINIFDIFLRIAHRVYNRRSKWSQE